MDEMNQMYLASYPIASAGIGFGTALSITISYTRNRSILWAILHGILGWLYVIYSALFHRKDRS